MCTRCYVCWPYLSSFLNSLGLQTWGMVLPVVDFVLPTSINTVRTIPTGPPDLDILSVTLPRWLIDWQWTLSSSPYYTIFFAFWLVSHWGHTCSGLFPSISSSQLPWGKHVFSPRPLCHDILPHHGPKARMMLRERQQATFSVRERNSRTNNKEVGRRANAPG